MEQNKYGGGSCISKSNEMPLVILNGVPTSIINVTPTVVNVKPAVVNVIPTPFIGSKIFDLLINHDFFIKVYTKIKDDGGFEYGNDNKSYMTNNGVMRGLKFDFNKVLNVYDAIGDGVLKRMRKTYDLLKPKFVTWEKFYSKIKQFVSQFLERISSDEHKDKTIVFSVDSFYYPGIKSDTWMFFWFLKALEDTLNKDDFTKCVERIYILDSFDSSDTQNIDYSNVLFYMLDDVAYSGNQITDFVYDFVASFCK